MAENTLISDTVPEKAIRTGISEIKDSELVFSRLSFGTKIMGVHASCYKKHPIIDGG